jgi:geranylgeranyl transferase type-1 subunit beta
MKKLDQVLDEKQKSELRRWCIMKQSGGFQGRPNKDADTCYSFWVGATLKLLSSHHLVKKNEDMNFIKSTEDCGHGGLAKFPNNFPGESFD